MLCVSTDPAFVYVQDQNLRTSITYCSAPIRPDDYFIASWSTHLWPISKSVLELVEEQQSNTIRLQLTSHTLTASDSTSEVRTPPFPTRDCLHPAGAYDFNIYMYTQGRMFQPTGSSIPSVRYTGGKRRLQSGIPS